VEGIVIESTVAAKREGRQLYRPVVRYRYDVGGERYEGSRIQWAASAGYRKYTRARRILDSYRSGHAIKVHYDPKRPGVAVLKPGHAMGLRPIAGVGTDRCDVHTLHRRHRVGRALIPRERHSHRGKLLRYSITSSAVTISASATDAHPG
jgi:hypothetical protein